MKYHRANSKPREARKHDIRRARRAKQDHRAFWLDASHAAQ